MGGRAGRGFVVVGGGMPRAATVVSAHVFLCALCCVKI